MKIVTTAMLVFTLRGPAGKSRVSRGGGWKYEGGIIELVGKFTKSLPKE